ncbi:MAG: hypothetical protein ACKOB4_08110 [Acidobacteriota bacterium]
MEKSIRSGVSATSQLGCPLLLYFYSLENIAIFSNHDIIYVHIYVHITYVHIIYVHVAAS